MVAYCIQGDDLNAFDYVCYRKTFFEGSLDKARWHPRVPQYPASKKLP